MRVARWHKKIVIATVGGCVLLVATVYAAVSVTIMFIASIFSPWGLVWGAIPVTIALIGWFWPKPGETGKHCAVEVKPQRGKPPAAPGPALVEAKT